MTSWQKRSRRLLKQLPRKPKSRNRKPRSRELRSRPLATQVYSPQKQCRLVSTWGSKNLEQQQSSLTMHQQLVSKRHHVLAQQLQGLPALLLECHISLCHVPHLHKHQAHSQPSQCLHYSLTHSLALGAMMNSAGRHTGADDELGPGANVATSCSQPVLHDCLDSVHNLSTPSADNRQLPNQWPASSDHTSFLNSSSSKPHVQSIKHATASVTTQVVTASAQYNPVANPSEQGQRANAGLLLCCPMTKVSPEQALKPCGSLTCMSFFPSSSLH